MFATICAVVGIGRGTSGLDSGLALAIKGLIVIGSVILLMRALWKRDSRDLSRGQLALFPKRWHSSILGEREDRQDPP